MYNRKKYLSKKKKLINISTLGQILVTVNLIKKYPFFSYYFGLGKTTTTRYVELFAKEGIKKIKERIKEK